MNYFRLFIDSLSSSINFVKLSTQILPKSTRLLNCLWSSRRGDVARNDGDRRRKTGPIWDQSQAAPRGYGSTWSGSSGTIAPIRRSPGHLQEALHITYGRLVCFSSVHSVFVVGFLLLFFFKNESLRVWLDKVKNVKKIDVVDLSHQAWSFFYYNFFYYFLLTSMSVAYASLTKSVWCNFSVWKLWYSLSLNRFTGD